MSQMQRPSYENLSIYDAPGVIASAAADGELTGQTIRSALIEPESLTPAERDTTLTRLKQAAGGNPITSALIDVMGNPWVWFTFLTSPAGMTALRDGKRIFDIDRRASMWIKERSGVLAGLGGLTPNQEFRGTSVPAMMRQLSDSIKSLNADEGKILAKPFSAFLESTGLPHLDYERIANPKQRELAKRISFALHGSLAGMDKAWVEPQVFADETGQVLVRNINHRQKVAVDLTDELRKMGGEEAVSLRDSMKEAMNTRIRRVFSDDDAILRVYRLISNPERAGRIGMDTAEGKDLVRMVMGDAYEAVQAGRMTPDEFTGMVRKTALTPIGSPYYMPKNLTDLYIEGKRVPWEVLERSDIRVVKPAGATIGRQVRTYLHDPEDLAYMAKEFGDTGPLADEIKDARTAIDEATAKKPVRLLRINAERGLARYFEDTGRTYAVSQAPSAGVLQAQAEELAMAREAEAAGEGKIEPRRPGLPEEYDASLSGKRAGLLEPISGITPDRAPMGGFSTADVLQYQWTHLRGRGTQERFQEVLLPRALGRLGHEATVLKIGLARAKDAARAFVETDVGKAIAAGSEGGKDFIETMKNWGEMTARSGEALGAARGLAKYLYGTHLIGNMASVVLNGMQPMLHASSWLGTTNVLKGYAKAIPEVWNYLKERVVQDGMKPLSEAEKIERFKKHFSLVNAEGQDLVGIAPTVEEALEGRTLTGARGQYHRPNWKDAVFELGMAPFQTAEMLNRLVTGHAVLSAYESAGRAVKGAAGEFLPGVLDDVRQAVQETQFGGDFLNTPWFMQKGWLSNPLLRQFTNFMYRSMTGLAVTSRQIGARSGGASVMGPFYDFARMMGTSAVIYEVGKNVLHADLSRGLAFSAVTDIIPGFQGGRFKADEQIVPVPPVFDIPWQMVKAVATNDAQLWGYTLPRLVPGGIAISRALGGMPNFGMPDPVNLQQTYAGWDQKTVTPEGQELVPIFKGDGTLLDWQSPASIVMRSLGVDIGQKAGEQGLDRYIAKQGQLVSDYRRKALDALISGDHSTYDAVRNEFAKRTGLPLVISKVQLDAAIRQREIPRVERSLDHLPEDVRPIYQQMVASAAESRLGYPAEMVAQGATASSRAGVRPEALGATPEKRREMERTAAASKGGSGEPPKEAQPVAPFSGFDGF